MKHERLSAYLARCDFSIPGEIWHYCPGCKSIHRYAVGTPFNNGAKWIFDGNAERPSLTPSMNIRWGGGEYPLEVCHYFITDGKIIYCNDSTHELKGKTVDLPPIPEHYWVSWK